MRLPFAFITFIVLAAAGAAVVPTVTLLNSATGTVKIPIVGLGTGGYTGTNMVYAQYPPAECFNACDDPMCIIPDSVNFTLSSCEKFVQAAVSTWIQLGGRRIDGSASYHNVRVQVATQGSHTSADGLILSLFRLLSYCNDTIFTATLRYRCDECKRSPPFRVLLDEQGWPILDDGLQ